jgi:hypothetical protein
MPMRSCSFRKTLEALEESPKSTPIKIAKWPNTVDTMKRYKSQSAMHARARVEIKSDIIMDE